MWNYGALYMVLSVERLSPAFLRVNMVALTYRVSTKDFIKGDRVYARRMKFDRLVGFAPNITREAASLGVTP